MLTQMLVGVSTRKYERSLEGLPPGMKSVATKKSSVSRRFVRTTRAAVESFLSRPLSELDLPVLRIDGKYLGLHLLLFDLGIDATGKKHVLGIWEGSTESNEVCRSLLRDLIERGLKVERPRLIVLDGGKGLRKAVHQVFDRYAMCLNIFRKNAEAGSRPAWCEPGRRKPPKARILLSGG